MEDLYNDYLQKLALSQNSKDKLSPTWEEMNKRLDKELPQKKDRKKGIIIWSSLLLILSVGLGYYLLSDSSKPTVLHDNKVTGSISVNEANHFHNGTKSVQKNIGINNVKNANNENLVAGNSSTTSNNQIITKEEKGEVVKSKQYYSKSLPENSIIQNEKKITFSNSDLEKSVNKTGDKLTTKIINSESEIEQKGNKKNDHRTLNQNSRSEQSNLVKSDAASVSKQKVVDFVKGDSGVGAIKNDQPINNEKKKNKVIKSSTWELVPTVAADYLIANIKPLAVPGFLAGIGVNYVLSKHVSLRAGILFNHIRVSSTGENYYYKPHYYVPNYTTIKVEDVKGYINALEVPLSVRYTINPMSKLTIHLMGGISSMFYLKTDCTYKLLINNASYQYWNSKDDKDDEYGKAEVLNNLRLGAGISYRISKNTRLEFEPSYKLPMEELGEEHKKIGSFSFNLSLRIPISKKK